MPQDTFAPALARLDPASRALLDLSLRREMRPEEIGDLLGTDPESVIVAREAALEQLASELGLDENPDLDDLRTRLSDLPSEAWTPQVEVKPSPEPTPVAEPVQPEKRRSRLPLLLALLALVAVVVVVVLASGGDDESSPAPQSSKPAGEPAKAPSNPAPASESVTLTPVTGGSAKGSANLVDGGKRLHLEVTGLPAGSYEVWLYNSVIDAQSIGKATGTKIDLDVDLPANATHFRYIDVSREPADGNPNHSGESVLRVPLVKLSP